MNDIQERIKNKVQARMDEIFTRDPWRLDPEEVEELESILRGLGDTPEAKRGLAILSNLNRSEE